MIPAAANGSGVTKNTLSDSLKWALDRNDGFVAKNSHSQKTYRYTVSTIRTARFGQLNVLFVGVPVITSLRILIGCVAGSMVLRFGHGEAGIVRAWSPRVKTYHKIGIP